MSKVIGILMLSLSAATIAQAGSGANSWWGWNRDHHKYTAPEIDPASAVSGLTLLVGGLAVIRGRRPKK